MFGWLTRRRQMIGGLHFGPPGWAPDDVEDAPAKEGEERDAASKDEQRTVPESRADFTKLLALIGLGRASAITPGLHEQMAEIGERNIRAIVLNLLPTQPEFALSSGLTRAGLSDMMEGLGAIQRVVKAKRVLVLADRHDWRTRRLWKKARKAMAKADAKANGKTKWTFDVEGILNQYPLGHPTLLLRRLFAKRLPVGRLPVRVNRMIVDPVTCWGLGRWLRTGERFSRRPVQLFDRGETSGAAQLVMATIGESIQALCERYELKTEGMQVIVNGMLSGEQVSPAHARVETWTESVSVREAPLAEIATACVACGWCVDVCPTGLNPVSLLTLAEETMRGGGADTPAGMAQLRSGEARESLHCIGCGLCSYVCPTRLPLTQRTMRLRAWIGGVDPQHPRLGEPAGGESP